MSFFDNWLNTQIARLGYIKANAPQLRDISTFLTGASPHIQVQGGVPDRQKELERLALTSSWVFSNIKAIAQEVSQASLDVLIHEDNKPTVQPSHEFLQILQRPNPFMGGSFLKLYTLWWWLLHGEAYWWKVFDNAGKLTQIYPVPADKMQPIGNDTEYIYSYAYTQSEGMPPVFIPPEQVVFFRFPNPFNYRRGLSPLTAYRLSLETDIAAANWNKETFENEVTVRTLLSLPKEIAKPKFEQLREELIHELVDAKRRYVIARAGDVKAETLGISHRELEFLKGREFTREEIDRVFGIPAGFWAKDANRANAQAARATMIEQAVWPVLKLMHEELTAQLIKPEYGDQYEVRFKDIRVKDRQLLIQEQKHRWVVQTINEARKDIELDELDDGDPRGEMLVPELLGAGSSAPPETVDPDSNEATQTPASMKAAAQADIRRWRGIALRHMKRGDNPGDYDFDSDFLPVETIAAIKVDLSTATDEQHIRWAFLKALRVIPKGSDDSIPDVPISDPDEDDAVEAVELWDIVVPEYMGLLLPDVPITTEQSGL